MQEVSKYVSIFRIVDVNTTIPQTTDKGTSSPTATAHGCFAQRKKLDKQQSNKESKNLILGFFMYSTMIYFSSLLFNYLSKGKVNHFYSPKVDIVKVPSLTQNATEWFKVHASSLIQKIVLSLSSVIKFCASRTTNIQIIICYYWLLANFKWLVIGKCVKNRLVQ